MPAKKDFSNSINPELYARSQQPASTIAMGMKSTQASALTWQDQVRREQTLQERWAAAYDPTESQETRKDEALQNTLARDTARGEHYRGVQTNPELHEILYQEDLAELQRQAECQASGGADFTNPNRTSGRTAAKTNASTQVPSWQKALPPATGPIPYHDGSARTGADGATAAQAGDGDAHKDKYKSRTEQYLTVRADVRTMPERFPQGPKTGTQVVGWQAYHNGDDGSGNDVNSTSNGAMYQAARARHAKGPYRRPEDATHAQLLGYDLEAK